jgi:hypothetical protein
MYPKSQNSTTRQDADQRKQAKREQLADLLLQKFRGKHHINPTSEGELDTFIKLAVQRFITPKSSIKDQDINDLDREIDKRVSQLRSKQQQSAQNKVDLEDA